MQSSESAFKKRSETLGRRVAFSFVVIYDKGKKGARKPRKRKRERGLSRFFGFDFLSPSVRYAEIKNAFSSSHDIFDDAGRRHFEITTVVSSNVVSEFSRLLFCDEYYHAI